MSNLQWGARKRRWSDTGGCGAVRPPTFFPFPLPATALLCCSSSMPGHMRLVRSLQSLQIEDWLPPQHLWSFLCSEIRSLPRRKKCESPRDSNNPPIQIRASILMKREVIVRAKIIRQRKSLQIPLSLFCSFNLCLRFGILRWRVSREVRFCRFWDIRLPANSIRVGEKITPQSFLPPIWYQSGNSKNILCFKPSSCVFQQIVDHHDLIFSWARF